MHAVTRPLAVRARVHARPEAPFDRLHDLLTEEVVRGGPLARERFDALWKDPDSIQRRLGKRRPLPPLLADALVDQHRRLGASPASLDSLDRLARGEAVCAISGQQPAPLGGPLFGLHKVASTVGLSRRVVARVGAPCVPVFWNHVEDSDFAEIRAVTVADRSLRLHELELPAGAHAEGGLVGAVPPAPLRTLVEAAIELWDGLPGAPDVAARLRGALARARDLGEAHAALLLDLFGDAGLVVVDPRLPEFRRVARPVLERYLRRSEPLARAVRQAGERLEGVLGRRPLSDAALESFVFRIAGDRRHKITPAEARRLGEEELSPSVALRPVVQDAVLPTVAMACGPGELAYLAQLREVYEGLEVVPACPVPRLGATWLPPAAIELLEAAGAEPWWLVAATDQVLRRHAEARLPADLRDALAALRAELGERLGEFARKSTRLDPSLPQLVESARVKIDYQLARLAEGLLGKARHRMERDHPEWLRLRYYLSPGDRLQERRLASLEPAAYRGARVAAETGDLAEAHAEELERGEHSHVLLEL
jgi:uncharacterized protein YllA (UPF0747 family)